MRPPWISKRWFNKCPFNYCDHFGNKERLATVCKICKEDIKRIDRYIKEGKDPYAWENVFKDIAKDLAETMKLLYEGAKKWGIDLDSLPDKEIPEPPRSDTYPIYRLVTKYSDGLRAIIKELEVVPIKTDTELLEKAVDVLAHSEHYIVAKIGRALSSRWRWKDDPMMNDVHDDKTSALLAFIAIERNSRALLALSKHKPLSHLRTRHLKLAKLSLQLCNVIKEEFFPKYRLDYEEFGAEETDSYFKHF